MTVHNQPYEAFAKAFTIAERIQSLEYFAQGNRQVTDNVGRAMYDKLNMDFNYVRQECEGNWCEAFVSDCHIETGNFYIGPERILKRRITISDLPLRPNWRIVRDSTDFNQIVITAYCGPLHATSATIAIDALHLSKYLDGVTLVELQNQIVVANVVSH
jgi:hypothetical protein